MTRENHRRPYLDFEQIEHGIQRGRRERSEAFVHTITSLAPTFARFLLPLERRSR